MKRKEKKMDRRDFLKSAMLLGGCVFFGGSEPLWKKAVSADAIPDAAPDGKRADTDDRNVRAFYFSPTGTTKRIIEEMGKVIGNDALMQDIAGRPLISRLSVAPTDVAIVGVPVYSGRVPSLALKSIQNLRGANTPAVAVVVYGNRDYDDALLELKDTLEQNGFVVFAGAAFIGQHALFPQVAKDRPDSHDIVAVAEFAKECLSTFAVGEKNTLVVKGNRPYREAQPIPLKPSIGPSCTMCGKCVAACPARALKRDRDKRVIARKDDACISCAACVHVCPTDAQAFRGEHYEAAAKAFLQKMSQRREPEFFF